MPTKIEWADEVWNPTTGCSKVSEGCRNCYAESIATRFWGERKFTDVQCHPERLDIPLRWKKPRRVFIDSMSDLFHDDVPDNFIDDVFVYMKMAWRHTFMILTKRPKRMQKWFTRWTIGGWDTPGIIGHNAITKFGENSTSANIVWPLRNVWLIVSAENQNAAQDRIPWLLATPAAIHGLSIEPMLERIDLPSILLFDGDTLGKSLFDRGNGSKIDWIIAGCESGPKARPSPPDIDIRYLKDQCIEAGIPFFLKQMWNMKMPPLDGRRWAEFPKERIET